MWLDELLTEHVQVVPLTSLLTSTTSSIRSKHGVADSEQDPGQAAREEAPNAAVLDLPMWKLPQLVAHSVHRDPAMEDKF
jgi:hypothetical protein